MRRCRLRGTSSLGVAPGSELLVHRPSKECGGHRADRTTSSAFARPRACWAPAPSTRDCEGARAAAVPRQSKGQKVSECEQRSVRLGTFGPRFFPTAPPWPRWMCCQGLAACGFECQAFCTAKLDLQTEVSVEKMIGVCRALSGTPVCLRRRSGTGPLYPTAAGPHHLYSPGFHAARQANPGGNPHSPGFFEKFLEVYRPDVLLTYGGDPSRRG